MITNSDLFQSGNNKILNRSVVFPDKHIKGPSIFTVVVLILFSGFSCNHNRLKTNEKDLVKELLLRENELIQDTGVPGKVQSSDITHMGNKDVNIMADRSVDPSNPPVSIDIAGSTGNNKVIRLSDIAKTISYIRMEPIPDSTIPDDIKFQYYIMNHYIIAANLYGIHIYTLNGKYLSTVVKNEMSGIDITDGSLRYWNDYTMVGGSTTVRGRGDNLYYIYGNNINGSKYIMEYDCSANQSIPPTSPDPLSSDQISASGTIAIDLNNGKTTIPRQQNRQAMVSGSPEALFTNDDLYFFDPESFSFYEHFGKFMGYQNRNKMFSTMRTTDRGFIYERNGTVFLRPAFNDTVFSIISSGRLMPSWVLNIGEFKVTEQQGVDPSFKLLGKIIPVEWAETADCIFITYTKDDYDCPNTRKNHTVKIYHALYSKLNSQLSVIKANPIDYSAEILDNDIDGGVPVWPSSNMIGRNNEIMVSLKGKDLKDRIKSESFKLSDAPATGKNALIRLAESVTDTEDILMTIH